MKSIVTKTSQRGKKGEGMAVWETTARQLIMRGRDCILIFSVDRNEVS
jgi:hypothetical protein